MHDLHISPHLLLGRFLRDNRKNRYQIVAVWLEDRKDLQPSFVALVIRTDGVCYKQYLPDMDIEFEPLPETM